MDNNFDIDKPLYGGFIYKCLFAGKIHTEKVKCYLTTNNNNFLSKTLRKNDNFTLLVQGQIIGK